MNLGDTTEAELGEGAGDIRVTELVPFVGVPWCLIEV